MKLIRVYPDSFVFEEPHRKVSGKNRLTISCHGNREQLLINKISYKPLQISLLIHAFFPNLFISLSRAVTNTVSKTNKKCNPI
ncbi:hypothetical protein Xind_01151 [Xenorhabdus indica]|nr:hypothetical protein [Xenorhabdus indica]